METKNGMMKFDDNEQAIAGIAAATSVENAPRIHARVSEQLAAEHERLERLAHADDDEITRAERGEIPALTEKVRVLDNLNAQLGELSISREAELFLRGDNF